MLFFPRYFALLIFLTFSLGATGQTLKGRILNEDAEPLSDVLVYNQTKSIHGHSLLDGSFSLEGIQAGDTLSTQVLGYQPLKYLVKESDFTTELLLELEPAAIELSQVNINGQVVVFVAHSKIFSDKTLLNTSAFASLYDFKLFSNFTFFLKDPINGDQIKQEENQRIIGLESKLIHRNTTLRFGAGFRFDDIDDNELSRTLNRDQILQGLAWGEVTETNAFSYVDAQMDFGKWCLVPALRLDAFNFNYQNYLGSIWKPQFATESRLANETEPVEELHFTPGTPFFLKSTIRYHF